MTTTLTMRSSSSVRDCYLTLICQFAGLTPAGDLARSGKDVAVDILEVGLRLFHCEPLVAARLLEHLPTRCDAMKRVARRHGLDIGVEQFLRCVEIVRRNGLDELTCAGELHGRDPDPADSISTDRA